MDQVFSFDKTLKQRLEEYREVLSVNETLSIATIQQEWAFYLELVLDPNGWQAVWKIQRQTCELLKIPFPSLVIVFVNSIEFETMSAKVKIIAVQDDIHIPSKHTVPLIQLWPTKTQDKTIPLNLKKTANAIDMLRFFYLHLVMPWDYEEEDTIDWKVKHLEPRLKLYYDVKQGVIPVSAAVYLQNLLAETKRLVVKRQRYESEIAELEEADKDINSNESVETLMELHVRLMEIKTEVDIFENPFLRGVLIKKHNLQHNNNKNISNNNNNEVCMERADALNGGGVGVWWLVFPEGTVQEHVAFLKAVEGICEVADKVVRFVARLDSCLENGSPRDVFVVRTGEHCIKAAGVLETAGTLKGIAEKHETIIKSASDTIMMDFSGGEILLENLTLHANNAQCAIVVRSGKVTLKNCDIVGDGKSSTHQGILLLNGGSVELVDCKISHFSTAIVGNTGSKISMCRCEVVDVNYGLKLFDNCVFKADEVTIKNCKDYGVCLETEIDDLNGENYPKSVKFENLNMISSVEIKLMKGLNNGKGDAIISHKSKLLPVFNLFDDPTVDPTLIDGSDDEMESEFNEVNATVIENDFVE